MNIQKLNDSDLADLAANVAVLLAGTELNAIEPALRTDLIAALGTLPADLKSESASAIVAEAERKTFFTKRNEKSDLIRVWMRRVRDALKTGLAPKKQFDACGIDYPGVRASVYVAMDPTNLAVSGFSNGVNKGQFEGNNTSGLVTYEIWRRQGDEGPWMVHMLTRKQTFTDNTGVVPGQYYEYKVRAVATQTVSNYSNSAVVYGTL